MKKLFVLLAVFGVVGTASAQATVDTNIEATVESSNQDVTTSGALFFHPPHHHPYPPPYYFTCYAHNEFGAGFWGQSFNAYEAQRIALNVCYSYGSRFCYNDGWR